MTRALCTAERQAAGDRCPGTLALHHAEDGWLARVRVPGGALSAEQLAALARASELGSGLVDVTSRANLQLRGLPAAAGEQLTDLLRRAALAPSDAHDRVRNVLASPLAGRHPLSLAATDAVVCALDRALCADPRLAELPGRFLFAIDDGSGLALGRPADVALVAQGPGAYLLALAGRATRLAVSAGEAPALAAAAAAAFLEQRRAEVAGAWRIAELAGGAAAVARRVGTTIAGPLAVPHAAPLAPGRTTQRDGRLALTALAPLGRLDTAALRGLARATPEVRLGAGRTVTVLDLAPARADALERELAALGLELRPGSGWVGLSACAGLGACPRARIDVRAAAAARAAARDAGAPAEHWAACERRCGEHPDQPIAVAAGPGGLAVRAAGRRRAARDVDEALAALA